MQEIWIETHNKICGRHTSLRFSNLGRVELANGDIIAPDNYYRMHCDGIVTRLHQLIAKYFIEKTEEDIAKNRNFVDHKTHNPVDIAFNDVRNLRWCTAKENINFEEVKHKMSLARTGVQHHTAASKQKLSKALKGRRWYNNGKTQVFSHTCPAGFVSGMLKRKNI